MRTTNANTLVAPVSAIKPGVMFKNGRSWYLADSEASRPDFRCAWDFEVWAWDRTGRHDRVFLHGDQVEVAREGYTPPTFRPASVRREAKRLEGQAEGLLNRVGSMRQFANRLEAGK